MRNWIKDNLKGIIITSFIIPILLVAFVSISHVTTYYELANPFTWAVYLSIAVEIAAIMALAGISSGIGRFIYLPFLIVTFIQLLGNFYFSYVYIDETSESFAEWMNMVNPIFEPMGVEPNDPISHKRILAFFTGGLLPFISLTFAHMLVVYTSKKDEENGITPVAELSDEQIQDLSKKVAKQEFEEEVARKYTPTMEDLEALQKQLMEIQRRKFGEDTEIELPVTEKESVVVKNETTEDSENQIKRLTYLKRD